MWPDWCSGPAAQCMAMIVSCIISVIANAAAAVVKIIIAVVVMMIMESFQLAEESIAFTILPASSSVFSSNIILLNVFELLFAILGNPLKT